MEANNLGELNQWTLNTALHLTEYALTVWSASFWFHSSILELLSHWGVCGAWIVDGLTGSKWLTLNNIYESLLSGKDVWLKQPLCSESQKKRQNANSLSCPFQRSEIANFKMTKIVCVEITHLKTLKLTQKASY